MILAKLRALPLGTLSCALALSVSCSDPDVDAEGRDLSPLDGLELETDEDVPLEVTLPSPPEEALESFVFEVVYGPEFGEVTGEGTLRLYTPDQNFHGEDWFRFEVTDGVRQTTGIVTITVLPVNDHPTAVEDSATAEEDGPPVMVDVLANDSDVDGDSISLVEVLAAGSGSTAIGGEGGVFYQPNPDFFGEDLFSYRITDTEGLTSEGTVVVTVAPTVDPPVAVDDEASLDEDTNILIDVLANDIDVDGDTLVVQSVWEASHGTAMLDASGSVFYEPEPDFWGTDSFEYTVVDPAGLTATAEVVVTVSSVNDPPVAVDDAITVAEDGSVTIDLLANDTDPDGDVLALGTVSGGVLGSAAIETPTTISYMPASDTVGTEIITYEVVDPFGASDTGELVVLIDPVNDAPVAVNDLAVVDEDSSVLIDAVGNDVDVDGDLLTISSLTQPILGVASIDALGFILYTPGINEFGGDSFTYTVIDPSGLASTAEIFVTIVPQPDPPMALADAVTVDEDTLVTVDVLANDYDPDLEPLTVSLPGSPVNGSATITTAGMVEYLPDADFNGFDAFNYTVTDPSGQTATSMVTVTILPVNDAPVAVADSATIYEDGVVIIDVLSNDSDIEGDPLALVNIGFAGFGTTSAGAVAGTIQYEPEPDYNGSDNFTYIVMDPAGGTATGQVTVVVTPVNDPPEAVDDTAGVAEDSSVVIDVLANDLDIDGDPVSVLAVGSPSNGSVIVSVASSVVTYTPDPNFYGNDSFTYTVEDPLGFTDSATVSIVVNGVNDAPVIDNASLSLTEGSSALVQLAASDPEGEYVSYMIASTPSLGTVENLTTTSTGVEFTYNAQASGTEILDVVVTDLSGSSATGTVTILIGLASLTLSGTHTFDTSNGELDGAPHSGFDGWSWNLAGFTLEAGATLTVTGTAAFELAVAGDVEISGSLFAVGEDGGDAIGCNDVPAGDGGEGGPGGYAGGAGGGESPGPGTLTGELGGGPGAGWPGDTYGENGAGGGGGAGHLDVGLPGEVASSGFGTPGAGGPAYASLPPLFGGSGGGGGSAENDGNLNTYTTADDSGGGGGGGGGAVSIVAEGEILVASTGLIDVSGGDGGSSDCSAGGGGGGSGGVIELLAVIAPVVQGSLVVDGGSGGSIFGNDAVGGDGSDGRQSVGTTP